MVLGLNALPAQNGSVAGSPGVLPSDHVRSIGSTTCLNSMCHGGASPSRDQFTIWSRLDFHSRAYATLVTARSARLAESLGLASATESARCTVCHAPYQALPAARLASTVNVTEGVSCEACHNPADSWYRGHTRPDWTYADRVHAGMSDLRSAYVRANTCVACHQVIDADIVKAGHPELIFELDGQSASEPRHWQEKEAGFGAKAWLVGQAMALEKISMQLRQNADPALVAREKALVWLLQQVSGTQGDALSPDRFAAVADWSDQLARHTSSQDWTPAMSRAALTALSATSDSFLDPKPSNLDQALRAERLALALDRLSKSLSLKTGQPELAILFTTIQNRDKFDPKAFSFALRQYALTEAPQDKSSH